ncbi:aminotransferase class I/II-fold pyridoxal phosphate-dependent enzyme [Roseomonas sp. OT10]|uniref:threonine aldolase family protein n=1 Tax=Roseomonas cutis TaxID=2897332 RepID=UPI001E2CD633|nr:threonine aldolase family protein [Roseomonas sp. OT10]UFN50793.1 aminotransferase class I/II-fold pyridoxal phosphate-dependent enzyme [Roseomonas sp. OT10]
MVHAPPRPPAGAPPVRINLYSDTQTRPTPAMRAAMLAAEVGDEQFGDDPTVTALCDRMAALLGKEAAVFLPSGTMCNVVALLTHCRPGDEVLAHESAHILTSEGGNHAALGGIQITGLRGPRGLFDADSLRAAIRPRSRYALPQTLLEIEQTANLGGGTVWPKARLDELTAIAREQGWATHMDGARLMNACVAAGIPAAEMTAGFDSVWLDFTKGLGAPLGAVLAGSSEFIDRAWRWKQRLGGSMRQAGISAAGCLYALDHHIDRLAEDHANAQALVRGLRQIPGVAVEECDTNLVYFDPSGAGLSAEALAARLREQGIQVSLLAGKIRACTHLDVTAGMMEEALSAIRAILADA